MRALFTHAADVPLSRVLGEHRRWLVPVGILLLIAIGVFAFVVLPLRQAVANSAARADVSAQALLDARADMKNAEATRDGQSQASKDLDEFYASVLPSNMTSARRITHVKLVQLARSHDVDLQSGAATPESLHSSTLERLHVTYQLSGDWDDIRQLIYEIETGPDFVVIDNVQLSENQASAALSLVLDLSTYYQVVNGR